jgi:hypothetical protein
MLDCRRSCVQESWGETGGYARICKEESGLCSDIRYTAFHSVADTAGLGPAPAERALRAGIAEIAHLEAIDACLT